MALKWVVYGILLFFQLLASAGLILFETVINPAHVSGSTGLLNTPVVYELWKFVRDFINLFFILFLLFSAFATIFQVEQFSIKKLFLNILLAALLINFSFPITRFLIDTANVPMYYFADQLTPPGQAVSDVAKETLKASNLTDLILGVSEKNPVSTVLAQEGAWTKLFVAIVFMFIFAITIVVLALMLLVRLIALIILLIFSAIGFAAFAFPGLQKYASQWWDTFWKYNFFGPAALLMLFVAVKFMAAVNNSEFFKRATELTGTNVTVDAASTTTIASMVLFAVPIIMLWFAMALANSFSIAGAGMVTGMGQKVAKWGGKKFTGYNAVARRWQAYKKERDKRSEAKFAASNIGTRFGAWTNKAQDTAHGKLPLPGRKAAQERLRDAETKKIYEQVEENKKNAASDSELRSQLTSGDKIKAAAAAISLSERKAIDTADDVTAALKALGNNTKEISSLFSNISGGAARGINLTKYSEIMSNSVVMGNSNLRKQVDTKLKDAGNARVLVDHKTSTGVRRQDAVDQVLGDIKSVGDQAKQESLFTDPAFRGEIENYVTGLRLKRREELEKAAARESEAISNVLATIP